MGFIEGKILGKGSEGSRLRQRKRPNKDVVPPPCMWNLKVKLIEPEYRRVFSRGWQWGKWGQVSQRV